MTAEERTVIFDCSGSRMVGVLHLPATPSPVGILLIGRWGSDRSSVHFGREAAVRGIALFRFDFRGRGDCEGPLVSVEETGEDLRSAVRAFLSEAPAVRRVVIFGLSEGAAAALLYAPGDPRVGGLILANPWIRMDGEVAKAHLRQNLSRVLEKSFWEKIRKSEEGYRGAARSFLALGKNWIDANRKKPPVQERNLKDRLMDCLDAFAGPIQIILSGGDPATAIFQEAAKERLAELSRQGRLTINIEPEANHVFSRGDWRAKMIGWSLDWTKDIC